MTRLLIAVLLAASAVGQQPTLYKAPLTLSPVFKHCETAAQAFVEPSQCSALILDAKGSLSALVGWNGIPQDGQVLSKQEKEIVKYISARYPRYVIRRKSQP